MTSSRIRELVYKAALTDWGNSRLAEQMRKGTLQVRQVLGSEVVATDEEIQESLYFYYYDVGKTVTWILSTGYP